MEFNARAGGCGAERGVVFVREPLVPRHTGKMQSLPSRPLRPGRDRVTITHRFSVWVKQYSCEIAEKVDVPVRHTLWMHSTSGSNVELWNVNDAGHTPSPSSAGSSPAEGQWRPQSQCRLKTSSKVNAFCVHCATQTQVNSIPQTADDRFSHAEGSPRVFRRCSMDHLSD